MASLGELFIEIGVLSDIKPLQDTLDKMKEAEKHSAKLLKYIQDLNKAQSESEKKLIKANFARSIAIQKTQKQVDGLQKMATQVAGAIKGLTLFVGGVMGAVYALNRMTDALTTQNQVWINFTRQTDLGLETLQKYAGVAGVLDKSLGMEGAAASIAQLNEKLFELQLTGQGARGFLLAGINPIGQSANGVLEQLRNRVSGLDNTSATFLLKQLGLDPRILPMLRMQRTEFEALNAEINKYQLRRRQREDIQKYQQELSIVNLKLQYLKDRALLAILPAFTKFMQSVARVAEFFARLAKSVGSFLVKFRGIIALLAIFAARLAPVQNFITGIKGALGAIVIALEKIPIVGKLITGVLAGLGKALLPLMAVWLLIDDIMTYMQGGESYTGDLVEWFSSIGENLSKVFETICKNFGDGMKALFLWIWSVTDDILGVIAGFVQFLTLGTVPLTDWLDKARHSNAWYDDVKSGNYDKLFTPGYKDSITNNNQNNSRNVNVAEININTTESMQEVANMCTIPNAYFSPA